MTDEYTAVRGQLTTFFVTQLLDAEQSRQLTPQTSLKEWGVLNSLGMARLVAFIREDLGVEIPLRELTGGHFRTLEDITSLVMAQRVQA